MKCQITQVFASELYVRFIKVRFTNAISGQNKHGENLTKMVTRCIKMAAFVLEDTLSVQENKLSHPQHFYTKDALFLWTKLDKHLYFIWLCVSGIKMGTKRLYVCLDELLFQIHLEQRNMR